MTFLPDVKSKIFPAISGNNHGYSSESTVSLADRSITGRVRLHGFVTAGMANTVSGTGNWGGGGGKFVAVSLVQIFDLNEAQNDKETIKVEFPLTAAGNYNCGGPNYCDFGKNYIQFDNGLYLFDVKKVNTNTSATISALKYMSLEVFYSLG